MNAIFGEKCYFEQQIIFLPFFTFQTHMLLHYIDLEDCDDASDDDDADDADDDDDDDNDVQARRALRLTLPLLQLFLQPHAGQHHSCHWNHDHNNPNHIHYHHLTCCQWGQCRHWQQAC